MLGLAVERCSTRTELGYTRRSKWLAAKQCVESAVSEHSGHIIHILSHPCTPIEGRIVTDVHKLPLDALVTATIRSSKEDLLSHLSDFS